MITYSRQIFRVNDRENPYIRLMTEINSASRFHQSPDPKGRGSTDQPGAAPRQIISGMNVPIRALNDIHRLLIAKHLFELDAHDRYLRFGYFATDEHVQAYVAGLDFERDEILGVFNRKLVLIAMAHLAYSHEDRRLACAEFGVSVLKSSRGRGYGARLFDRAAMDARNKQVKLMYIHALSENTAMLRIARKAGAIIERDGSESEAFLRLPNASLNSRMTEIVEDHCAQIDYQFKAQSKQLRDFLTAIKTLHGAWLTNDADRGR